MITRSPNVLGSFTINNNNRLTSETWWLSRQLPARRMKLFPHQKEWPLAEHVERPETPAGARCKDLHHLLSQIQQQHIRYKTPTPV